MSYPKWKFKGAEERKLVQTPDEEKALGKGWGDKPAVNGKAVVEEEAEEDDEKEPPKPPPIRKK